MTKQIGLWLVLAWVTNAVAQPPEAPRAMPPLEAAATMELPRGFRATMFAAEPDVRQPIGFCLDDRARLWVAEAYNYPRHGDRPGDRIVILEDVDGDGRMDRRKVFYDQLNYVTGIEVGFGGVWVVSPPSLYFIPDRDHDDQPDGEPVVLLDGFGNHANSHNLANGLAWGPDGWLYGTHGRTNWSMLGKPGATAEQRVRFDGGVYRYHPVRHVWEPYADGTTNPWGIDWNDHGEAFVTNCVNPHLFHVIPGAHYEPWRNRKSSEFAYERIPTIADHLHFTGVSNVRDGLGSDAEDAAGGGHAHCGTMIYLGQNWPARYRNSLFTNNIHGKRINNDLLQRQGSTYVASHAPDVLCARDPWFVGVTLAQGPAGEVYVSDWSDIGECHYVRNTHKETGRIFRLTYGELNRPTVDLTESSSKELARLHASQNEWMVRHARRILHERVSESTEHGDEDFDEAFAILTQQLDDAALPVPARLRALWTLHAVGALSRETLTRLANVHDEGDAGDELQYLRSWALRLLCEEPAELKPRELALLRRAAAMDPSTLVQLHLASVSQRLAPEQAWPVLDALSRRPAIANDKSLALMTWYGVEPLVGDDAAAYARFAKLGASSVSPLLARHVARRLAGMGDAAALRAVIAAMLEVDESRTQPVEAMFAGALTGLQGRRKLTPPSNWPSLFARWSAPDAQPTLELEDRLLQLALVFQDPTALKRIVSLAKDSSLSPARRSRAVSILVQQRPNGLADLLLSLVHDPAVQGAAIRGLSFVDDPRVPDKLLTIFAEAPSSVRQDVLQTLASRPSWASRLLGAIETGGIPTAEVTAYTVRSLRALDDPELLARLEKVWGAVRESPAERRRLIRTYQRKMSEAALAQADESRGRQLFTKHCGSCHKMFGEGGTIGPDLSGAQRSNTAYLLENLLDPSASVAKAYRMEVFRLNSGQVVTGIVENENDATISVYTVNQRVVLSQDEVAARKSSKLSIMPEGLLVSLNDRDVRDLLGYLRNARPAREDEASSGKSGQ